MPSVDIHYFVPPADGSRPYRNLVPNPETGEREKNHGEAAYKMEIEDIRGKEDQYKLDENGFQLFNRPTALKDFSDTTKIQEIYYPESVELIKELTGGSNVVVFDHTIRRRRPGEREDPKLGRQPVIGAHIDQTDKSSRLQVQHSLPDEAPKLVQGRFQILNLWRPIVNPAFDSPLGFCDFQSVAEGDFCPTALRTPEWEGETMGVKYNPGHKWKYLRGMTPDEFVLFKCFDSKEGVATGTPHTSFEDPTTPVDAPYRQSIELRALVFYD